MAIDREQLTRLIGRGEQPAYGVVPDGMTGYQAARYDWSDTSMDARMRMAARLLSAAGYSAERPLSINLVYDVGDIHERVALIVSGMWNRLEAVDVALDKREWQYFLATRSQRSEWDSMRFSWLGDYNDPTTFLDLFRSDGLQNLPAHRDADYDELLDAAALLVDDERAGQLALAEQHLLGNYPIAPLYFYVGKHLVRPGISGFENNVLDRHASRYLRFADAAVAP